VGIPEYLRKNWGESRWQRVAKYMLGNGMRGGDTEWRRRGEDAEYAKERRRHGSTFGRSVWEWERGQHSRRWWRRYWGRGRGMVEEAGQVERGRRGRECMND